MIDINKDYLQDLANAVHDFALSRGLVLKTGPFLNSNFDALSHKSQIIGLALIPSFFSKSAFDQAHKLAVIYNELYVKISCDPDWLESVLSDLIQHDSLISILWRIHEASSAVTAHQNLHLGIFRSDYMLHKTSLKQVEINTGFCAGSVHGNNASDMHRHLSSCGMYDAVPGLVDVLLPECTAVNDITQALTEAHEVYTSNGSTALSTAVLILVQSGNTNAMDERAYEYRLQARGIKVHRCRWSVATEYISSSEAGELRYQAPWSITASEISVVYFRAGYTIEELDGVGRALRILIESSRAIKCPSILTHLAGMKAVQEMLTRHGQLERFLAAEDAIAIRKTFMPMFKLDDTTQDGREALALALNPLAAKDYILKPSGSEGGGCNFYGEDISLHVSSIDKEQYKQYILMRRIEPPKLSNVLTLPTSPPFRTETCSELGLFGTCLWAIPKDGRLSFLSSKAASFSYKTKSVDQNEMSVAKGFGCFDSPALVDLV